MACNNCNSEQSITYTTCNPCTPPVDCSCAVLLKTSCVNIYDGDDLECAGIQSGIPLNDVLKAMDAYVCAAISGNIPAVNLENIGTGAGVYAGVSNLGKRQLRKLKSSNASVTIVEGVSDIDITVPAVIAPDGSETKIVAGTNTTVTGIGTIVSPYSINANIVQETYSANNVGEGAEVFLSQTGTNPSTFNFRKIKKTTLGAGGIEILKSIVNSGNEVDVQTKSLASGSLNITDELNEGVPTGRVLIEVPTDVNNRTFFVNQNSIATEEFGTQAKPFKTLKAARDAYIGTTGTEASPQFAFTGKIELLSDVVLPSNTASPNYIGHLSANHLNIEGNGYRIEYNGAIPYFISTKRLNILVGLNGLGQLNASTSMTFSNVTIESKTQHRIMEMEGFANGTVVQNSSSLNLKNVTLIDNAYLRDIELSVINNTPSPYINTGASFFGLQVFAQNTLLTNNHAFKIVGKSWDNTTYFASSNLRIVGSSSVLLYIEDAAINTDKITLEYNAFYRNYQTLSGSNYSVRTGLHALQVKNCIYLQIEELIQSNVTPVINNIFIGGMENFIRMEGFNNLFIRKGSIFSDRVKNIIGIDSSDTGQITFENFNTSSFQITQSAFLLMGSAPALQKTVYINGSIINSVAYTNGNLATVKPTAISAQVNGYAFTSSSPFSNNATAIAGGLVQGNIYYNTTTSSNTTVV